MSGSFIALAVTAFILVWLYAFRRPATEQASRPLVRGKPKGSAAAPAPAPPVARVDNLPNEPSAALVRAVALHEPPAVRAPAPAPRPPPLIEWFVDDHLVPRVVAFLDLQRGDLGAVPGLMDHADFDEVRDLGAVLQSMAKDFQMDALAEIAKELQVAGVERDEGSARRSAAAAIEWIDRVRVIGRSAN